MVAEIIAVTGALTTALLAIRPVLDLIDKWRKPPVLQKILKLDRKPRIVIVDDDATLLETIRVTLNGDYEVLTYRKPFDALAEIASEYRRGQCFDLLIIDYVMGRLDGLTMVKIIRLMESGMECRSPIVILTGMGKMIDKPAGVKAVWRKPEDVRYLSQRVAEIL